MMGYKNSKTRACGALTLLEMVIALAMMAVVFAVIVPQIRNIRIGWDSKEGIAETLQNGRVLTDHLSRNLTGAVRITAVSAPDETAGYIEFENNDSNALRYDIAANNYVEFGSVGDLYELAGPVSQLQFTCYDGNDFSTPIVDVNNVADIRFVQVETTLTNPAERGQDKTFATQTYIRTNYQDDDAGWILSGVSEIEFDTNRGREPALCKIDDTHYLCAYEGNGSDGWAVVLTVDTGNWNISGETPFEFDNKKGEEPALVEIDNTHYLCAYRGDSGDGWAVVLTVDTGNWNITGETPFEFDIKDGGTPALYQIDSTHYLCAYEGNGSDGWAVVLTVDTGNWSIGKGTAFEYDNSSGREPALAKIDDEHYLCAYRGPGSDGWAMVLTVDTGNWSISEETPFEFDNKKGMEPALVKIDDSHYLCAYRGDGDDGWAIVLRLGPPILP